MPVLPPVGRTSAVVGRGKTIVTVALSVTVLLVCGMQGMGLGNIMLWLRIDERKGIDRGLWRPGKHKE